MYKRNYSNFRLRHDCVILYHNDFDNFMTLNLQQGGEIERHKVQPLLQIGH